MAITPTDVKLYASERLTDTDDGGGRATGKVIVDGDLNNLFPDISRLDRTIGDVALRKAFVGVATANADSYLGAHAILTDAPDDPNVSAVLFHADHEADERHSAANRIESYVVRGAQAGWYLLGHQYAGQRLIIAFQDLSQDQPEVGQVFELISTAGDSQFIRLTEVEASTDTFVYSHNGLTQYLERRKLTLGISAPLDYAFEGGSPTPGGTSTPASAVQRTEVADAARYYGLTTTTQDASQGDLSLVVARLTAPLVPSAQSEAIWADQPGGYLRQVLVPTQAGTRTEGDSISWSPTATLYSHRPIVPGTLSLDLYGSLWADDGNGHLEKQSGSAMFLSGRVDYIHGVVTLQADSSASGACSLTYQPGVPLLGRAESGSLDVTLQNRSFSWTLNLADAKPRPATLVVQYRAQGKWQTLQDIGAGQLDGDGTGTVNFTTGTVAVTFPVMPDVGSCILYAWIAHVADEFALHSGSTSLTPAYTLNAGIDVEPGSVTLSWTAGGARSATDNGRGQFTGDATGTIHYANGAITLRPNALVDSGTLFTVAADSTAAGGLLEAVSLNPDGNGSVSGTLSTTPIQPGSVSFTFNVRKRDTHGRDGDLSAGDTWELNTTEQKVLIDDGSGGFTDREGHTVLGAINYATGAYTLTVEALYPYPRVVGSRAGAWGYGTANTVDVETLQEAYTGTCNIRYQDDGASYGSDSTDQPVNALVIPLPAADGPIIPRSLALVFGGQTHIDLDGTVYRDPSGATGIGTAVGSIDYANHTVVLSDWPSGAGSTVTIDSLATQSRSLVASVINFRTPGSPIRPGSLQITAIRADTSALVTASADADGLIRVAGVLEGTVDVESGQVRLWFTSNTSDETGAADIPIFPGSLRYNAVSYAYLPLDAELIGIDPVRLPADGQVPIFRDGDVVVLAHSASTDAGTPGAGEVVTLSRDHQADITVVDAHGVALDPAQYSVDRDAGTVTFADPVTLQDVDANALTPPLSIEDRIEHMTVISDAQVSGDLAMIGPLAHDYPAGSTVSSALLWGDLQARVANAYTQKTWNSSDPNWSGSRLGDDTTASYNLIDHPLRVTNHGAISEHWALVFTGSTAFQIVGEQVGIIGTGNTGQDTAPTNPNTGHPYFIVPASGWGTGWVAGNVLRFDTIGCLAPLWIARTIVSGQGTVDDDSLTLQLRGDAD